VVAQEQKMKIEQIKKIMSVLMVFMFASVPLFAQTDDGSLYSNFKEDVTNVGTSAAAFLEIGVGARSQALGGAFTALANDASALYWNPAGIVQLNGIGISVNHADWLAGTNFEYFGLVLPAGNRLAFGLSLTALDYVDKQPVRTIFQPEGTGEFYGASDMAIGTTVAMALTDRFSFGMSLKYIQQKVWHESAHGFATDFGVLYKTAFKGLSLGTSISNFGTDLKLTGRDLLRPHDDDAQHYSNDKLNTRLVTDSFSLPLTFRFGIAYGLSFSPNHQVTTTVDVIHPSNNVERMNVGLEYSFLKLFALRCGYQSLFDDKRENGLTMGFGARTRIPGVLEISVSYGYSNWGLLGDVQRISLDLSF